MIFTGVLAGAAAPASAQPARWPVAPAPINPGRQADPAPQAKPGRAADPAQANPAQQARPGRRADPADPARAGGSTRPNEPTAAARLSLDPRAAATARLRGLAGPGTAGGFTGVPDQSGRQGTLDRTFGQQGVTVTPFPGRSAAAGDVALLKDGSIIAAGGPPSGDSADFLLARYSRNGVLDGDFGDHGLVVTPWAAPAGGNGATGVAVGRKDRIVAVGTAGLGHNDDIGFAVAQYRPDGSLDRTFGTGGRIVTPVGPTGDGSAFAVLFQPDGKIVVVGGAQDAQGNADFAAVRYLSDGRLDPTFGTGGAALVVIPGGNALASAVALQPDGKIVLGGTAVNNGENFCVVRLTRNGAPDPDFGTNGIVLEQNVAGQTKGGVNSVAIAPGGRIVVGGLGQADNAGPGSFGLMRFLSDGTLDPTFGGGTGKVLTTFDAESDAERVVVRKNGSIVAVGVDGQAASKFALAGYRPNGDLDPAFGDAGRTTTAFGSNSAAFGAALQSTGAIVAVGATGGAAAASFAVARYLGPPTPSKSSSATRP